MIRVVLLILIFFVFKSSPDILKRIMTYKTVYEMRQELESVNLKIIRYDNKLKYECEVGSYEYHKTLKEQEELIKKKKELENGLRLIKQFER